MGTASIGGCAPDQLEVAAFQVSPRRPRRGGGDGEIGDFRTVCAGGGTGRAMRLAVSRRRSGRQRRADRASA